LGSWLLAALLCCARPGTREQRAPRPAEAAPLGNSGQPPQEEPVAAPESIGAATMKADGVLEIMLQATDGRGAVGDALLRLAPGDRDYQMWLAHLGGLKPGESKLVRPFPAQDAGRR
jgi:hypothetical protein